MTEINKITCSEARELFSPLIDNCLSIEEHETLNNHFCFCSACRDELTEWRTISLTLSQMQPLECPDHDFSQAIINTIKTRDKTRYKFAAFSIKKQFAAAAAVALIMFSSLGVHAGIKLANNNSGLTDFKPSEKVEVADNSNISDRNVLNTNITDLPKPDLADGEITETNGAIEQSTEENSQPRQDAHTQPEEPNPIKDTTSEMADTGTPVALLSQNMVIESSVIKMAVNNPVSVRTMAQEVAVSNNGKANVMSTQGNSGPDTQIIQITVPHQQKDKVISSITGLGIVTDKNDDRVDITSQYNELLVQYNELLANNDMSDRKTALKQQLSSWEQDTKSYTILLLLVNNNLY